jgi:lysyl-tRNA synthetase class 2
MALPSPFWDPDRHADRRPFLLARNAILRAIRGFFETQGFVEVDPSVLQVSPGNEAHLHAFRTEYRSTDGAARLPLYLHTSPEFACKKLLAAGETRLFSFAHVFRNREHGALHHPEFTMLEWYRVEAPYEVLMEDCAGLLRVAARAAGTGVLSFEGRSVDPALPFERLTVAEAFARHAGIDLLASIAADGGSRCEELARMAHAAGIRTAADDGWADIFARVLVERIEPRLGHGQASILDEYPVSEAALARQKPGDRRVAQRFELYAAGSSSPTASASSPIRTSNAAASSSRWRRRRASTASATPWTRISWPRSRRCRRPAA